MKKIKRTCAYLALLLFYLQPERPKAQEVFETQEYLNQAGLGMIRAADAYRLGFTGKGVTLGILDSGISALHPEFIGQISGGYDFTLNQSVTPNFGFDSGIGHGSHVSGIMAARRDGNGMHGVAFNANIFSVRAKDLGDDDDDDDDASDYATEYEAIAIDGFDPMFAGAWNYMASKNLVVINNSLGVNDCSASNTVAEPKPCNVTDFILRTDGIDFRPDRLFNQTRDALFALQRAGTLMVFATGNEAQPHPDLLAGMPYHYPVLKPNWLAVTSVEVETGNLASYSNQCGVAASWCLAAPGSLNSNTGIASVYHKGGYIYYPGTSMAAPHVTGAVALVKEAFPFFNAYHLQQTILTTTTDLTPSDGRRFDDKYGWGLLNVGKAVRGPGLFTSTFDIDTLGYSATFSNDIGDLFGDPAAPVQRGSLIKRGAGTLTLSGINSYTGTTTVVGGTLQITGTQNTGDHIVNGGKLVVNGTIASNTTTTVNTYGILGGSGSLGHVDNKGTVAPGNSIGTLTIAGNYTAFPGSVLGIEVNGDSYDILNVSGTTTLQNGAVLSLQGGPFRQGITYNFLRTGGPVANNGLLIDTSLLFLTPGLQVPPGGSGLAFVVNRNTTSFASYTYTDNQAAVARALDGFSSTPPSALSTIYDDILNARANTFPGMMDQLSGEAHASVQSSLYNQGGLWTETATRRMNGLLTDNPSNHHPLWVSLQRQWADMNGHNGSADARRYTNGFFLGSDIAASNDTFAGAAFGYHDGQTHLDQRNSHANTDSYTFALYGATRWQTAGGHAIHWRTSGAWTHHDIDMRRNNVSVGGNQTLTANYSGQHIQAYTELGYALPVFKTTALEPFVRLGWTHQHTDSFSESGGPAALYARRQNNHIFDATLGVRSHSEFAIDSETSLRLTGELAWRQAHGNLTPQRTMAFDQFRDANFRVKGNPVNRNALQLGLNGEINIGKQVAVGLNYSGQFGDGNTSNTGAFYLNVRF